MPDNVRLAGNLIALGLLVLFVFCGFVLWVRAWLLVLLRWNSRKPGMSLLMILLCFVIPIFSGFILHFVFRSEANAK